MPLFRFLDPQVGKTKRTAGDFESSLGPFKFTAHGGKKYLTINPFQARNLPRSVLGNPEPFSPESFS